jgi:hypothetical protein
MKITETDLVWVPVFDEPDLKFPNAGTVRVERHMSRWERTPGDRWMPAASLGAMVRLDETPRGRFKWSRVVRSHSWIV